MWRYVAGGGAGLAAVAAGAILWTSRDTPSVAALPARPIAALEQEQASLPDAVPEASAKTREEKRFGRYDKDRNGQITREEYLVSRRKAYAKLDTDGDGRLSFDEWAAKTNGKFATADADKSGTMSAAEFATTAVKRKPARAVKCPPAAATAEEG
ncbi:histidine kinase [Sphingomonas sp. Leaf339]|uniref:EF-hand domain-containing protein n=1 Tax=Sphingomonas sp. Leaf339 TaxID=1736343 RepID=UPI0006FECA62|nr:EF-hand domain-containing protein [Sphingomonas sp. Leaf339]KQU59194.1 histidine kinase [Sphingomonas sp. Leaf339]